MILLAIVLGVGLLTVVVLDVAVVALVLPFPEVSPPSSTFSVSSLEKKEVWLANDSSLYNIHNIYGFVKPSKNFMIISAAWILVGPSPAASWEKLISVDAHAWPKSLVSTLWM